MTIKCDNLIYFKSCRLCVLNSIIILVPMHTAIACTSLIWGAMYKYSIQLLYDTILNNC